MNGRCEITLSLKDDFAGALRAGADDARVRELHAVLAAFTATLTNPHDDFTARAAAATHAGMAEIYRGVAADMPPHRFAVAVKDEFAAPLRAALKNAGFADRILVMT